MSFRRVSLAVVPLLIAFAASAGERAQTSGARRPEGEEKKEQVLPPEAEAKRATAWEKLLRNRQFDVLRSGNSLQGSIDLPMPLPPSQGAPIMDPKTQKRILEEIDRRKNWLVEPGSTTPRGMEKPTDPSSEIPDFSRNRGRFRSRREVADETAAGGKDGKSADGLSGKGLRDGKSKKGSSDEEDSAAGAKDEFVGREKLDRILSQSERSGQSKDLDRDRAADKILGLGTDRGQGWFQFNSGGSSTASSDSASGSGFGGASAGAAAEFLNPYSDPSVSARLPGGASSEPARSFDPTVAPALPFIPRDDGAIAGNASAFGGAAAAPASPFGSPSQGGTAAPAGFGAFNSFSSPAASGGGRSGFFSQAQGSGLSSGLEAPAASRTPVFVPRPAVLVVEPPKPF
jgi:hypothetical protein